MTQDKRYLSYTQINSYMTCPLRYNFQYVERIPPAFTPASLAFGSAIHEAVAAFYQCRIEGDDLRSDQMLDVYRQTWAQRSDVRYSNGDNENSLLDKARMLIEVFRDSYDPSTQILGVEELFQTQIARIDFQGYIDLIEQDSEGNVYVVDLKTASRKMSESSVHSNLQLTAYALGAESLGFNGNTQFRLDVLMKGKMPEMVRYPTSRTSRDKVRFTRLVEHVWKGITEAVWYPKEDWHCGQCAYSEPCEKW